MTDVISGLRASQFPPGVAEKIGNYVYRLIDPRNGETFYIGKGKGQRVFAHMLAEDEWAKAEDTEMDDLDDPASLKVDRIRAIRNAGLEVMHVIHRHGIPQEAIFEVEAALIDAYPGLSNIQGGHYSADRGPMNVIEIIDKFALPEVEENPPEKLVLININRIDQIMDRTAVYRQTQLAWRISSGRASKADYVLSVVRGVVIGAFVVNAWRAATHKNFPDRIAPGDDIPSRKGFIGYEAPEDVWNRFVGARGKQIVNDNMRHNQNPIRYWNL